GLPGSFRFYGPEMRADPYPVYHTLRSSQPVFWAEAIDAWILTRYDDVAAILRDGGRFSSDRAARMQAHQSQPELAPLFRSQADSMLHSDAPKHAGLGGLVRKAFTPHAVHAMRPAIQAMVDQFLDAVQPRGRMDVIRDLAEPLPVLVIAAMLGVPPEDRARFK